MTPTRTVHCPEHPRQVGICPACQRERIEAEKRQLAEVHGILVRSAHARQAPGDAPLVAPDRRGPDSARL